MINIKWLTKSKEHSRGEGKRLNVHSHTSAARLPSVCTRIIRADARGYARGRLKLLALIFGSPKYQLEMETCSFALIPPPQSYPKVCIVLRSSRVRERRSLYPLLPTTHPSSTPHPCASMLHSHSSSTVKVGIGIRNNCKATCRLLSQISNRACVK